MLTLSGFKQYSLTIGGKYERTFLIHDVRGILAEYVLGECGDPESPLPKDFFTKVKMTENAVELTDDEETRRFTLTLDQFAYSERSRSPSASFSDSQVADVRQRAKHLVTGALKFLQNPDHIFFGIVWEYVKTSAAERQRFNHPCAEFLTKHTLKLNFDVTKEYPAEMNARVTFRRRLQESVVQKGENDFANVILTVRDEKTSNLWRNDERLSDDSLAPRVEAISIDVQHYFDPHRALPQTIFESHWKYSLQPIGQRISSLLGELAVGA